MLKWCVAKFVHKKMRLLESISVSCNGCYSEYDQIQFLFSLSKKQQGGQHTLKTLEDPEKPWIVFAPGKP